MLPTFAVRTFSALHFLEPKLTVPQADTATAAYYNMVEYIDL